MIRRALLIAFVTGAAFAPAAARASLPQPNVFFIQDPLGTISDVTANAGAYQPAQKFCIKPNVFEATTFWPGSGGTGDPGTGKLYDGTDPDCAFSGFGAGDTGLYKFDQTTLQPAGRRVPLLCPGCKRIFIDFSKIPANSPPLLYYAHGHAYFRFESHNFQYIADPYAHSPNMKNFTNDKLLVPEGSFQQQFVQGFDTHAMAYVSDTSHFAHAAIQGPWYAGPWYVNEAGVRINGVYLDIDVNHCGASSCSMGNPALDMITYETGFNDGEVTCPDKALGGDAYADGNYFYGGCFDHFGFSSAGVDPFA